MNFATRALLELQETTLLAARAFRGIFKRPRYIPETIAQMDSIGVGSLTIIILTGFFTGGVLTVQTFPTLKAYGAQSQTGYLVAVSLVRELGPVLCALMVTGRVGSAISAELGSMVVSQQIDAMRALGTDPIRKLVAPRMYALLVSLPLLTVLADVLGIFGGWLTDGSAAGRERLLEFDRDFMALAQSESAWRRYVQSELPGGPEVYEQCFGAQAYAVLRGLKAELDPRGLLNRGSVFPAP
jgi:phospholipid/cholesterol/gamma-HCH transport system permease protein